MPKKKETIPEYGTVELKGITYYRTRITDADGKRVPLYAETPEPDRHQGREPTVTSLRAHSAPSNFPSRGRTMIEKKRYG